MDTPDPAGATYSSYSVGYAFTPTTNLLATHVRYYGGTSVSLWADDGTLLAAQSVPGTPGVWKETPLVPPVELEAGMRYRVSIYNGADSIFYVVTNDVTPFDQGTIDAAYETYGNYFPTYIISGIRPLVDLRYTVRTLQAVPLSPTNSAPFTNGMWTGSLTLPQPGVKILLRAEDEVGHLGWSDPFALGTRLGIRQEGTNVILSWPAAATGYVLESATGLSQPATWSSNTLPAAVVSGEFMVTNPITPGPNLFRLRWP
jgi:hypothetical protein